MQFLKKVYYSNLLLDNKYLHMSPWPVWYSSSDAALLAKKEAQERQKQKDEEDRKRRLQWISSPVKDCARNVIEKK